MSTGDRILNGIGSAASGFVVAVVAGELPVPYWLKLTCAIIAPVFLGSAAPILKRNSMVTPPPDARGQIADSETPK